MQTLLDEGRAIIPIPQYISLFSLLLFSCSFPVTIKPKIVYSSVYEEIHVIFASQITKFPVNFPVNGNFGQRRVRSRLRPPPAFLHSEGLTALLSSSHLAQCADIGCRIRAVAITEATVSTSIRLGVLAETGLSGKSHYLIASVTRCAGLDV